MIGRSRSDRERSAAPDLRRIETPMKTQQQKDPRRSITGAQIRAARGFLRWSARRLADKSELSLLTVRRAEAGDGIPPINATSVDALQKVLEAAGVVFLDENSDGQGVRLRKGDK
jgi:ribosome-binding protein aMBF1 (putative translation factor)